MGISHQQGGWYDQQFTAKLGNLTIKHLNYIIENTSMIKIWDFSVTHIGVQPSKPWILGTHLRGFNQQDWGSDKKLGFNLVCRRWENRDSTNRPSEAPNR